MSDTADDDNTGTRPLNDRLNCPGCVRSFRTESTLDRHLRRNPSHSQGSGADSAPALTSVWDNGWVTFDDRVERAVVVPCTTENVDIAAVKDRGVVEVSGDYDDTVALPESAGASPDTLRWRLESGVLRLTLDAADDDS